MIISEKKSSGWSEAELAAIEDAHAEGISVQAIVDAFAARGERLTEATFRKYVQLGLLPRSVRVARKGKRRGSLGLYPASVVRQIDHIRRLMAQGFTMEEIQREFLFIRGDIEELTRHLERIFRSVEERVSGRGDDPSDAFVEGELNRARQLATELRGHLEQIERRVSMKARMARAAV